jgi:hypothetical protein
MLTAGTWLSTGCLRRDARHMSLAQQRGVRARENSLLICLGMLLRVSHCRLPPPSKQCNAPVVLDCHPTARDATTRWLHAPEVRVWACGPRPSYVSVWTALLDASRSSDGSQSCVLLRTQALNAGIWCPGCRLGNLRVLNVKFALKRVLSALQELVFTAPAKARWLPASAGKQTCGA